MGDNLPMPVEVKGICIREDWVPECGKCRHLVCYCVDGRRVEFKEFIRIMRERNANFPLWKYRHIPEVLEFENNTHMHLEPTDEPNVFLVYGSFLVRTVSRETALQATRS